MYKIDKCIDFLEKILFLMNFIWGIVSIVFVVGFVAILIIDLVIEIC